jgi:hypothetical protein
MEIVGSWDELSPGVTLPRRTRFATSAHTTVSVPVIDGWMPHERVYVPGSDGATRVAVPPASITPVSKPAPVTVCCIASRLTTVTVAPRWTVIGENAKPSITNVGEVVAPAAGAAAAFAGAAAPDVDGAESSANSNAPAAKLAAAVQTMSGPIGGFTATSTSPSCPPVREPRAAPPAYLMQTT